MTTKLSKLSWQDDETEPSKKQSALETLIEGHDVNDERQESLARAIELGASEAILVKLRDARRLARSVTITLPSHRYEQLSRGRGWARKGKGSSAEWGERTNGGGYRVGPGRWTVGANDGFNRKAEVPWIVKHVTVGSEIWTIAD